MNKKILSWLESLMEEEALGLAPNPYQEAMKKNIANQATAQAVQEVTQSTAPVVPGKIIFTDNFYTRDAVSKDLNNFYLFGDNTDDRLNTHYIPTQTQAVIRGLPNAIGIDTKHNRGWDITSFLSDADFDSMQEHYNNQFKLIEDKLKEGHNVIIPRAGIGTGKAQLPSKAPKIFKDINNRISNLYNVYNKGKAPVDLGSQQMTDVPSIADLVITNNPNITASKALEIGGIDTLRHPDKNGMHFGNPFSPLQHSYASVKVNSIKDSVDAFRAWLQGDSRYANVEPQRRQWIVDQINNGSLKGKPLVYYTNKIPDNSYGTNMYNSKTAPNHAHVLLDMINNGIPAIQNTVDKGSQQMANTAQQFYEVSSAGDKRFSALYATFKPGTNIFGQDVSNRTIESVYQHGVKQGDWITNNNYKTGRPMSKAIITGNTEDDSYTQGYLPLWQEWAKQNPDLIEDLRTKSKGMKLSDKFARTKVSQARALTDILNTVPSNEQLLSKLANSKDLGEAQFKVISGGQTGIESLRASFSKFNNNELLIELERYNKSIQNEYDVRHKALDDLLNFASSNKALTPIHKERMLKRIPIISNNLNKLTPEKISFSDMQKTYNDLDKNVYQKYTDEQINNYINKLDRATDLDVSDMLESANNYSELSEEDLDYYLNLLKTISRNRRF